jgi:hypothetical protein
MMRLVRYAVVRVTPEALHLTVRTPLTPPRHQTVPYTNEAPDVAVAAARAWAGPVSHVMLGLAAPLLRRAEVHLPPVAPDDQRAMVALDPARWFVAVPGTRLAVSAPDASRVAYAADAAIVEGWVERLSAWAPVRRVVAMPAEAADVDERLVLETPALREQWMRRRRRARVGWSAAAAAALLLSAWGADAARDRRLAGLRVERAQLEAATAEMRAVGNQLQALEHNAAVVAAHDASHPSAAAWIARLGEHLPADAVIQRLTFADGAVRVDGAARSAREVLDKLTRHAQVRDARFAAPSASVGTGTARRETFAIAFALR